MVVTLAHPTTTAAFPRAQVEACLRFELTAAAEMEAGLRGLPWPQDASAQSTVSIHVDSLVVVGILCAVEPVLQLELPESVVRSGGYRSINQAIIHLLPGIQEEWRKRNGDRS